MQHRAKFITILFSISLPFAVLVASLHGHHGGKYEFLAHTLENLLIFLVGPIYYAANFFSRSTYIFVALYSMLLCIGLQVVNHHIGQETFIVITLIFSIGGVTAEIIYRTARIKEEVMLEKHRVEKKASECIIKQKTQLLASVSHEIRNPLNGMCGMINLLTETPLNKDQTEYVEVLKNSTNLLMTLVNDLLDASKIQAGKLQLEETDFSLREIIDACSKLIQPELRQKGLAFESTFNQEDPPLIKGDRKRLQQIILNLIGNATKFTDEGSITVHRNINRVNEQTVQFDISVSDTGIGIPEDEHDGIFELYSQVSRNLHSEGLLGSGLGLAISRKIAEQMGGTITLKSKPGKGSTFTVSLELPIVTKPPPAFLS
ncbi:MAG: ATP-binding protein [Verrucomicrobiota bacterium]|nr:ATP-binding protein [Verrucomicrobiota bacterium]